MILGLSKGMGSAIKCDESLLRIFVLFKAWNSTVESTITLAFSSPSRDPLVFLKINDVIDGKIKG